MCSDWQLGTRYWQLGYGAVAQLGERLVCNQEATGSIPVSSTRKTVVGRWPVVFWPTLDRQRPRTNDQRPIQCWASMRQPIPYHGSRKSLGAEHWVGKKLLAASFWLNRNRFSKKLVARS